MKKRILFTGEASFLNTGFSNIYRELLPRLVKTGKYLLAEQGSYARADDSRIHDFIRGRWKQKKLTEDIKLSKEVTKETIIEEGLND